MASVSGSSLSSSYLSYSPVGDTVWSTTDLEDTSSSARTTSKNDYVEENYFKVFQISDQTSFLCGVNRDVSYDAMIEDIFSKVAGNEVVIYPRSCDDSDASVSHVRKRLVCEDSFWEGAFVYTAKCLLVTLNAVTRREEAKVPECLERDVCIFTKDYPPIVFSLVRDSNKLSKSEEYNKLVGRKMTFLLRNKSCVSVMSEVLDLTNDSKIRIEDMKLESLFAIKTSLLMDQDKLRDAVGSFLRCIGLSETFCCFHKDSTERKDVFLTQDELLFLMEALDGVKEIGRRQVTSWAPFLASEVAVRLAKTSSTLLELTPAHRRITDLERLMEGNPLLDVEQGNTKECVEMTRVEHYVSECSGVKNDSPSTNVWIFETELAGEMRVRKSTQTEISRPRLANLPKIQKGPLVTRWIEDFTEHPTVTIPKEYRIPLERDRRPMMMFAPYKSRAKDKAEKRHVEEIPLKHACEKKRNKKVDTVGSWQ
ncbi:uncharacterized protein [Haliotis cracherodii]|uniref:uncharacterized protein n=1 Tax=Haliotis cracherodii TaxID=6455 RepID=UPI0039EA40FD